MEREVESHHISYKEMQRQVKIAFFISYECKTRVWITRIWNQVMNFGTGSGYPVPATNHYCKCNVDILHAFKRSLYGRRFNGGNVFFALLCTFSKASISPFLYGVQTEHGGDNKKMSPPPISWRELIAIERTVSTAAMSLDLVSSDD